MTLALYMDEHVASAITEGLRRRGIDVLTIQEDGRLGLDDPPLLDRATELGRVLFTRDRDLLQEGARRQQSGEHFAGIIYAHLLRVTIGQCIQDLELLAGVCEPQEIAERVQYLPLR